VISKLQSRRRCSKSINRALVQIDDNGKNYAHKLEEFLAKHPRMQMLDFKPTRQDLQQFIKESFGLQLNVRTAVEGIHYCRG
jgi:hypothetical protein